MTRDEARFKARAYLDHRSGSDSSPVVEILDEHTMAIPFGWVFFYQSKKHLQTKDMMDALAGNAPILVDSRDGSLHITGTERSIKYYIQNYQDTGDPHVEAVPVLVVSGWREGAQKVAAIRLLNQQTSLGLARSKHCIDDALDNIPSRIQLSDFGHADKLRATLDDLGWNVAVDRQAPDRNSDDAPA